MKKVKKFNVNDFKLSGKKLKKFKKRDKAGDFSVMKIRQRNKDEVDEANRAVKNIVEAETQAYLMEFYRRNYL